MGTRAWYKYILTPLYLLCLLMTAGGVIGLMIAPTFYLQFIGVITITGVWFLYLFLIFAQQEPDAIQSDLRKWLDQARLRRS